MIAKEAASSEGEMMIRGLARLQGSGAERATVLVWEAYVRSFPNRKALGAYAGSILERDRFRELGRTE